MSFSAFIFTSTSVSLRTKTLISSSTPRLKLNLRVVPGLTAAAVRAASHRSASGVASAKSIQAPSTLSTRRAQRYDFPSSRTRSFHASAAAKMGVHNLGNKSDYTQAVEASKSQLMVLDCYATWCGPCKVIAPKIVEFSEEFTKAAFYKLDVDDVPDVAQELGIRAMPTFLIFKGGEKVSEVVGANPAALKTAIKGHYEG